MRGSSFLFALALVGCDQAQLVVPETVEHAAVARKVSATTTAEALRDDRSLPPAEDYVVSDAIDEDWTLLAFYNAAGGILSVHSTSEVVSCGPSANVKIKPLADRLVVEPRAPSKLTRDGTVFTRVYAPVTRAALEDFLADVCLFLDTATPAARGRIFWAYTYDSYNQSSEATTPYTLTITGSLLDASEDGVHLHLVRHYLVPPGGDPSDVRRLVALGPNLKWTGP